MNKTTFSILKMDCASEEQMIRMKLADLEQVRGLDFDLRYRLLTVTHESGTRQIADAIDALGLNSTMVKTETIDPADLPEDATSQRRLLVQVLAINFFFFLLEAVTGILGRSMGLVADSLDMLADSIVYGLALLAIGSSFINKKRIVKLSGYFQLLLALIGFGEVVRRFLGMGDLPSFLAMIMVSVFALMGNALSLYLLQRSRSRESYMKASMIFTSNDVIINVGVIAAGILVYLTASRYPDLIIGTIVFMIVIRGAMRILKLA